MELILKKVYVADDGAWIKRYEYGPMELDVYLGSDGKNELRGCDTYRIVNLLAMGSRPAALYQIVDLIAGREQMELVQRQMRAARELLRIVNSQRESLYSREEQPLSGKEEGRI